MVLWSCRTLSLFPGDVCWSFYEWTFFFADKATDFTGKGRLGGEQEGKETRGRTALLHDLQLWVNRLNVYNLLCKVLSTNPPLNSVCVCLWGRREGKQQRSGKAGRGGRERKAKTAKCTWWLQVKTLGSRCVFFPQLFYNFQSISKLKILKY